MSASRQLILAVPFCTPLRPRLPAHCRQELVSLDLMRLRHVSGFLCRAVELGEVKRELYKKVISYMTIGIDVSSVFRYVAQRNLTNPAFRGMLLYSDRTSASALPSRFSRLSSGWQRDGDVQRDL